MTLVNSVAVRIVSIVTINRKKKRYIMIAFWKGKCILLFGMSQYLLTKPALAIPYFI